MDLLTPDEVGFVADYDRPPSPHVPDGYVFHWPGVDRTYKGGPKDTAPALRGIEHSAMQRGWWGFQYDYWVDLAGFAGIGRGTGRSGATSGDFDEDGIPNNDETDAVLLLLGIRQVPTRAMIETAARLVLHLGKRRHYLGHRQASTTGTPCPGDAAMSAIVTPMARKGPESLLPHQPPPPERNDMALLVKRSDSKTVYHAVGENLLPIASPVVARLLAGREDFWNAVTTLTDRQFAEFNVQPRDLSDLRRSPPAEDPPPVEGEAP